MSRSRYPKKIEARIFRRPLEVTQNNPYRTNGPRIREEIMKTDQSKAHRQFDPAEAHLHLRNLIDNTARRLAQRNMSQGDVLEVFHSLRTELLDHFRHEEECGFFDAVVDIAPRLKTRADALLNQHPDLQLRLEKLRAVAQQGQPCDAWWRGIADEYASFYEAFDLHERGETALLQEAYTRDVGDKD